MVKSTKKALVICMAAAMMMSSVTGCSGGGAKADASPTTEAVTEAKQEEAEVTEADSGSGEADESDEDSEDVEYSFSTPDGEEIGDAEDPGCNEASMMIEDLKSPVTSENRGEYDYTDKAMEYLNYIGTNLKDRNAEDPEGSDHNKAVDWIKGELKAAGYTDDQIEDQETKSDGYNIHNIVLTIPGEDDSKQILAGVGIVPAVEQHGIVISAGDIVRGDQRVGTNVGAAIRIDGRDADGRHRIECRRLIEVVDDPKIFKGTHEKFSFLFHDIFRILK